jgi:hypothetical protein
MFRGGGGGRGEGEGKEWHGGGWGGGGGGVESQTTGDLLHRLDLGRATDARHRDADVDRGPTPAKNRSDSRKIWPSVIEMTFVGMYAETSPACVSMIGSAVRLPPP